MQRKLVITALGSFGFGVLVGWAVTADIRDKKLTDERKSYDELLKNKTEHIWALQDRLDNPFGVVPFQEVISVNPDQTELIEISSFESEEPIRVVEIQEEIVTEPETIVTEETVEETRSNLQQLIDNYTADPDAQEEFASIADTSIQNDKAPPFVISRSAYSYDEEGEHFSKITLTYYPRDRVLLDDDDEPIEDVISTVGWRSLSQFGGESEDPDVVFVRNRRMMTDFEVVKEEESGLPLHVKYGMEKEEFRVNRAAGLIKLRQEDDDN